MHQDQYVFSQLVSFLDRSKFNRIVAKYGGDKYVDVYKRQGGTFRWCVHPEYFGRLWCSTQKTCA